MNSIIENFFKNQCSYSAYGTMIKTWGYNHRRNSYDYDRGYHDGIRSNGSNIISGRKSREYKRGYLEGWSKAASD